MKRSKQIEIFGAVLALAIGVYFGYVYSNRKGAGKSPLPQPGALQLLAKDGFLNVTLSKKEKITHDTLLFTFTFPNQDLTLGMQTGQHVFIHANVKNSEGVVEEVVRKYTPVSSMSQKGSFALLIKIYRLGANPDFPNGGKLTPYLENLEIGEEIKISGPKGRFSYFGNGEIKIESDIRKQTLSPKVIGLIAGGSGITPMYQLIQDVLNNPNDPTKLVLLFGNRSEEDILLKKELDEASKDPRITVYYTVDKATSPDWKGLQGRIDKEMVIKTMPKPSDDVLICTCGPFPMNRMLLEELPKLGHKEDHIFKF